LTEIKINNNGSKLNYRITINGSYTVFGKW